VLRERDPVHRSHAIGGWALFRYEDCASVLRDARFSCDDRQFFRFEQLRALLKRRGALEDDHPTMLRLDPPEHTRLRSLVQPTFTPRAVDALRPRIEALVEELLDELHGRSQIELMADLATPLPLIVIAELLGIPSEDRAQFKAWSRAVAASLGSVEVEHIRRATIAGQALRGYFEKIAEQRRRRPSQDLLSELLQAEDSGDRLSPNDLFATLTLLLVAGNETTTNLIGNGVLALLRQPEQLAALRADPSLMGSAVEEMLRYDSPVQATSRIALEDLQLGGRALRRGEQLMVVIGSANRDPERFPDPDRFDIARGERGHLSFGLGRHTCLGAALARLEARVALAGLLRRFAHLELAAEPISWSWTAILRGPRALPLRVKAA
jgi:cytochrome P450